MFERIRLGQVVEKALLEEKGENAAWEYIDKRDEFEAEKWDIVNALIETRRTINKNGAVFREDFNYLPKSVQDLLPKVLIIK